MLDVHGVSFIYSETLPGSTRPFRPCLIQLSSENTALLWRLKRRNKNGGRSYRLSPGPTLVDVLTSTKVLKVRVICKCSCTRIQHAIELHVHGYNDIM